MSWLKCWQSILNDLPNPFLFWFFLVFWMLCLMFKDEMKWFEHFEWTTLRSSDTPKNVFMSGKESHQIFYNMAFFL